VLPEMSLGFRMEMKLDLLFRRFLEPSRPIPSAAFERR
jgi:hypothetical protein